MINLTNLNKKVDGFGDFLLAKIISHLDFN